MEPKEQTKEELAEDLLKKLEELKDLEQTTSMLKANVNEFVYKDKSYRVHKPVSWEKDECNKERMKRYVEMLKDPRYMFRKQMIALLQNKGVDILEMENESKNLYTKERDLLKRLAQATLASDITTLKAEIQDLRYLQQENFGEREELLKYCIEKQLEDCVRYYLLYLILEVKDGDKWERVFKTYKDFQDSDDDVLLGRAAQMLAYLVYNEEF